MRAHFETRLPPYGVTLQQYNVLRILRGSGEDGLPTLENSARRSSGLPASRG